MLAYVFWHWPRRSVTRASYEGALRAFHAVLASERPKGFLGSAIFRLAAAPWLPQAGYEDWYWIEDFASLGILNEAAISGGRRTPHDAAALAAAGGVAGLYRQRAGRPDAGAARSSSWFSKPMGTPYGEFLTKVERLASRDATIWQRQMTLGPTPEFCMRSPSPPNLPVEWKPVLLDLEPT